MKKVMIVSRSPEAAKPDFEGHAYYEYFYDRLSENFDLTVLSSVYDEPYEENGITYYPWHFDNKVQGFKGIFKAIKDVRPDIVWAEDPTFKAIGAFTIAKLFRSSTVIRMAGLPCYEYKSFLSSFLSDKKIAVSHAAGDSLYGDYEVIFPGTDFPEEYEERSSEESVTTVGYLGRFDSVKGTDRLVELAKRVLPSDEVAFEVAGRGEYKEDELNRLDQKYSNFNLRGRIPHEKVFNFLSGCDLLFMPSRKEGLPRAAVESLYVGTPVIGWDIEPFNELIDDEKMIVGGIEEAKSLITKQEYSKNCRWFDSEEFEVEAEMEKIKDTLSRI